MNALSTATRSKPYRDQRLDRQVQCLEFQCGLEKSHEDAESVVEYREKTDVLAELETFVGAGAGDEIEMQEYDEDIAAWAETVRGWLKWQPASFTEMMKGVKLSFVRIWLALLLDRFDLRQNGDFYDCAGIMISLR